MVVRVGEVMFEISGTESALKIQQQQQQQRLVLVVYI